MKLNNHSFNGWGVTMVDSLSTMLLMGLDDEFARALPIIEKFDFVAKKVTFIYFNDVSTF